MSEIRDLKRQLRNEALARRDALEDNWRIDMSVAMTAYADCLAIEPGTVVSGYWPMRSEVDIRPLMSALADKGARLCLPAIIDRTTIIFRELVRGADMIEMGFGTYGPGPEARQLQPQIMLVPLAAFDARGHRIGYGAGYYDRAIEKLRGDGADPFLIGVAFDCQQVPQVPDQPHDIGLEQILTESGLHRFPLSL